MNKKQLYLLSLTANMLLADATTAVKPYLNYRSQNDNPALVLVGQPSYNKPVDDSFFGHVALAPHYTRSFNADKIAQSLFGWWLQDCNTLNITGSEVANRNEKDFLADWFYLDGAYEGSITLDPVIQNASVDMQLYWGMDHWAKGLFFRAHAPLTWTKWNLGACFKTVNAGNLISDNPPLPATSYAKLLPRSLDFFCGKKAPENFDYVANDEPKTTYRPLTAARFCDDECCNSAKTLVRLADIHADFGWNFIQKPTYIIGLFARGIIPTGNRPTGEYLFEPIIGNGHHWGLGGGVHAQVLAWENIEKERQLIFTIDGDATHLFRTLQHRVFDLKNRPLSRYMTAYRSNNPEMAPVANLTATTINSTIEITGNATALASFITANWSFDLGYNFWAQSCEKINCSTWSDCCYGKNIIANGYDVDVDDSYKWQIDPDSTIHTYNTPTSRNVIQPTDIDYDSAQTKGMSHKVFGHVNYVWRDVDYTPFFGIGAEGEFGQNSDTCCATSCCSTSCQTNSCCDRVSLSQWGIWAKGGFTF